MKRNDQPSLSLKVIESKIYTIRGLKVMIDSDLSALYQVENRNLKRQVRRNIERFPEDFMFVLTKEEFDDLRCQTGTSSWGGTRYLPMAFTEQGVAMLSSVLSSPVAIQVNIQIVRVFSSLKTLLVDHKEVMMQLDELTKQAHANKSDIQKIFSLFKRLVSAPSQGNRPRIGYKRKGEG
jgi:hypothetical protein